MTPELGLESAHLILQLIKSINREWNLLISFITYEMNVIKTIAERMAVLNNMDNTKIVEEKWYGQFIQTS